MIQICDEQKLINCKESQTENERVENGGRKRADDCKNCQMKSRSSRALSVPTSFESRPKVSADSGCKNVSNDCVVFRSISSYSELWWRIHFALLSNYFFLQNERNVLSVWKMLSVFCNLNFDKNYFLIFQCRRGLLSETCIATEHSN